MKPHYIIYIFLLGLAGCNRPVTESSPLADLAVEDFSIIRTTLDSIYTQDQQYRLELEPLSERYGWKSVEINNQWDKIRKTDSSNLIIVEKILNEYGWLSAKQIGSNANSSLFLVIQHSDIETQVKYLPMMRVAVKMGNADGSSLALLEDRVALRRGEKQIYGSQIRSDPETGEHYVMPLVDPENVNIRRAEVGLGSIQEYIAKWGMTWDLEAYKTKLPEYEAKQK